jgi:hypothetical protein
LQKEMNDTKNYGDSRKAPLSEWNRTSQEQNCVNSMLIFAKKTTARWSFNMAKSENTIQGEIRLALSKHGIVLRLNSGKFWQGERVWSKEFNQYVLVNLRPVQGCPEGTPDLLFLGKSNNVAFIECKTQKGAAREKQKRFIEIMRQYGIKAALARSVDDALKIIGGN